MAHFLQRLLWLKDSKYLVTQIMKKNVYLNLNVYLSCCFKIFMILSGKPLNSKLFHKFLYSIEFSGNESENISDQSSENEVLNQTGQ